MGLKVLSQHTIDYVELTILYIHGMSHQNLKFKHEPNKISISRPLLILFHQVMNNLYHYLHFDWVSNYQLQHIK